MSALWKRGPVVLFFYPKDDTAGCTAEVCAFRDAYDAFQTAGATVVGISSQGTASKKAFATRNRLPFTLLSDPKGAAAKAFGVKKTLGMIPGRVTFVIDRGGVIRHRFDSLVRIQKHVEEALEIVRTLEGKTAA